MLVSEEMTVLEARFRHLYLRLRQLEEQLCGYFLYGDPDCLVPYDRRCEDLPRVVRAAFDGDCAEKYEREMHAFFSGRGNGERRILPRPKFSVSLEIEFMPQRTETYEFPFTNTGRRRCGGCANLRRSGRRITSAIASRRSDGLKGEQGHKFVTGEQKGNALARRAFLCYAVLERGVCKSRAEAADTCNIHGNFLKRPIG